MLQSNPGCPRTLQGTARLFAVGMASNGLPQRAEGSQREWAGRLLAGRTEELGALKSYLWGRDFFLYQQAASLRGLFAGGFSDETADASTAIFGLR